MNPEDSRASSDPARIRVAFVTTNLGIGGAERLLFELITRLDRTRFEPRLFCLKQPMSLGTKLAGMGIPVHAGISQGRFDFAVLNRLADLYRTHAIQIACTVGTGGDRSFWGRLAARWARVPVVLSCPHSMGVPDKFERHNRLLSGITDAFIAVAHTQKSYLVRSEGFSANKVHVIHNGVDIDRFRPAVPDPAVRAAIGVDPTVPLAGLVAYLRPEKQIDTFLRAAALVRGEIPRAQFVIVGDGPERSKLHALRAQLGLETAVHFAGLCQDVRDWIRAIDVLLLTSRMEAFPVSLLEAMACAKPVIATNVGAIPEMVVPETTGYLVQPGDPTDIARATSRVLRDPEHARELGRQGRQLVENRFSLTSMVRGYERLFVRLLEKSRRVANSHRFPRLVPAAG